MADRITKLGFHSHEAIIISNGTMCHKHLDNVKLRVLENKLQWTLFTNIIISSLNIEQGVVYYRCYC